MKYLLLVLSFSVYSTCQSLKSSDVATTIYLVRHTEKADDGTRDPDLTDEGRARAERIAEKLKDEKLTAIYSTDYKRTRNTAEPVAKMQDKTVTIYDPRDLEKFKDEVMKKHKKGEKILIVGHSNTTPNLANLFLGSNRYKQIEESNYENFYVVELLKNGEWRSVIEELK